MRQAISAAGHLTAPQTIRPNRPPPPGWVNAHVMALIWGILVAYGTLVPFNFDDRPSSEPAAGMASRLISFMAAPQWQPLTSDDVSSLGVPNWINDFTLNVLLYVPLGVLLRHALARRFKGRWTQIVCAITGVLAMSWTLDCVQALTIDRVPSRNDVFINCLGGFLGSLMALWLSGTCRELVFWSYCRVSYVLHVGKVVIMRHRRKPYVMLFVIGLNMVLVAYWCAVEIE